MAKFDPKHVVVPVTNFGDKNSAERFLECGKFRRCANLDLIFLNQQSPSVSVYLPACNESRFDRTGVAKDFDMPTPNTWISPVTFRTVAYWAPLISCPRDCKGYRSQRWARILRWLRPKATQKDTPASGGVFSNGWVQTFGGAFVLALFAFVGAVTSGTDVKTFAIGLVSAAAALIICLLIHFKEIHARVALATMIIVLCCVGVWTRVRLPLPPKFAPPKAPEVEHSQPPLAPQRQPRTPQILLAPSYGNLKQRCEDMAASILNYASERENNFKNAPPGVQADAHMRTDWDVQTTEYFYQRYLSDLTTLRDDLAKHDIKDLQLDRVISMMQSAKYNNDKWPLHPPIRYPMSAEYLRGVAGILMKIAGEIPPV
jgi:hypothetical protein